MSHKRVRAALESRLNTWGTNNNVPIVFDNVANSNTQPIFITSNLIPAETQNPSMGVLHERFTGTFRVLVRHQNLGKGMGASETYAESIQDFFQRGLMLTASGLNIWIENTPSIRSQFIDGMYIIIPVDIPYRADSITN